MSQMHPSRKNLAALASGGLSESEANELNTHLAQCPDCRAIMQSSQNSEEQTGSVSVDTQAPNWQDWSLPATLERGVATSSGIAAIPSDLASHPRYRVLELLGTGGMGAIWKAEHRSMGRIVALKSINSWLIGDPDAADRFAREVHVAAQLSHPNVVTAYDADRAGNTHFLVMEFVTGVTLTQHVQKTGPLDVARACDYARQAALGLEHAFERGLVHRDLKPHNLMLTSEGRVKILDFGLARFIRETEATGARTEAGAVLGTPDFMAPEQAVNARAADIRADIYSLGCTLYFLLTGQPPFPDGTTLEKLLRHQMGEASPIEGQRHDLPVGLAAIVRRMMARRPEDRFQSPAEVAAVLAPFCPPSPTASAEGATLRSPTTVIAPVGNSSLVSARGHRRILIVGLALVAMFLLGRVLLAPFLFPTRSDGENGDADPVSPGSANNDSGNNPPDKVITPREPPRWEKLQVTGAESGEKFLRIAFPVRTVGFAASDRALYRTEDGGTTWKRIASGKLFQNDLYALHFRDARRGWVISNETLHQTEDGGTTWAPAGKSNVYSLVVGPDDWLLAGGHGSQFTWNSHYVFSKRRAGPEWDESPGRTGSAVRGLSIASPKAAFAAFAAFDTINGTNAVIGTTDRGATWKSLASPAHAPLAIHFADEKIGWMTTAKSKLYRTEDGGKIWKEQPNPADKDLPQLAFEPRGRSFGIALIQGEARIVCTADGTKWSLVEPGGTGGSYVHAVVVDPGRAFLLTETGHLDRYIDPAVTDR